jgi:RNA polymerase sigma-70 factor (ECF subfamily)
MDPELLGRLLDRHAAALELYARQWCDSAEDVVQEAYVKLSAQRRLPDNPAAWLFRVVRHGAINAAVAARRRKRHEAAAAGEALAWFQDDRSAAVDPEMAEAALRTLPIAEREVIVAHLWGGLTFEQVAALAGRSTSTTHRLYQSGLSTLRERLGVSCRRNPIRTPS